MADVKIRDVNFSIEVVEPVGPLSSEEVRKIVGLVLEAIDRRHQNDTQRNRDTRVRDRVWDPDHD